MTRGWMGARGEFDAGDEDLDTEESECPRCDNGIYNGAPCSICGGTGKISEASLLGEAGAGEPERK